MKVYCKNCKYCISEKAMMGYSHYCNHPLNLETKDAPYEPYVLHIYSQSTLNKDNKCKNYEKKWWRGYK